jgi:hypothetical protein
MSQYENDRIWDAALDKAAELEIDKEEILSWELEDAFNFLMEKCK